MGKRAQRIRERNLNLFLVILLFLIMCLLSVSLRSMRKQEDLRAQQTKAEKTLKAAKAEQQTLAKAQKELEKTWEEVQKEAILEKKEPEAEQIESKVSEEENLKEESETGNTLPEEIESVMQSVLDNHTLAGEEWSVYVRACDSLEEVAIHDVQMQAASLIKLYIMGAVYEQYEAVTAENGKDTVDNLLHSMITVSDNDASNSLTKMLGNGDGTAGRAVVNDYCARNGYANSNMGRMLLEQNPSGDNYTSVGDCGKFLVNVYNGSVPYADSMLSLLKQQERTGKIPAGIPSGVVTANKTGELETVENDAAIIFAEGQPYILCVMSGKLAGPQNARDTIVALSSEVYQTIVNQ